MLLQPSADLSYLHFAMLSWTMLGPAALVLQALGRPIPALPPFRHRFAARFVPNRRIRYIPVCLQILHHPLTVVCFLCYPSHAENLPVVCVFSQIHCTTWVLCFLFSCVTYVLYLNKPNIFRGSFQMKFWNCASSGAFCGPGPPVFGAGGASRAQFTFYSCIAGNPLL